MSRVLVYVSLIATLALGAHAEYKIGEFVGLDTPLAYGLNLAMALPVAIDCYVLAALIAARDVPVALTVLAVSIGGGHVYIGAAEKDIAKAITGGAVGLLLVAVLWRVEELAKHDAAVRTQAAEQRRQEEQARAEAARLAQLTADPSPVGPARPAGEAPDTVPGAGGTPPAAPPRGRSTTTRPAGRPAVDPREVIRTYARAELDAGRTRPTVDQALDHLKSRNGGKGMRRSDVAALLHEVDDQPAHLRVVSGAASGEGSR